MSWWLGWLDIALSGGGAMRGCGLKRRKRGRRRIKMNSEKNK